jgi:hypothetical protein
MVTFNSFKKARVNFLEENKNKDHVVIAGKSSVVISSPHGVSQVRLGKHKFQEMGSLCMALELARITNSYLIAKTKNNYDDANFDPVCAYKDALDKIIISKKITHVVDIHGLAPNRPCDVNLGVNMGRNVCTDTELFDRLESALADSGFVVFVDEPFSAGINTIAGSTKQKHGSVWTIQIEINSKITNRPENFEKCKILINVLKNWINSIENSKNC